MRNATKAEQIPGHYYAPRVSVNSEKRHRWMPTEREWLRIDYVRRFLPGQDVRLEHESGREYFVRVGAPCGAPGCNCDAYVTFSQRVRNG